MKTIHLIGCVKRDIMRWVSRHAPDGTVDLSGWYCGVTHVNESSELAQYLKGPNSQELYFRKWLANDSAAASEILRFFIKNGMQNRPIKGDFKAGTRFVFTFKVNPLILDDLLKFLT